MALPKFHTRYSPPPKCGIDCGTDSLTRQEFQDECDINRIMARALRSGVLPQQEGGMYGDFSELSDYQQAQDILLHARKQFQALPSGVRDRFGNDPAGMLAFIADPANKDEARRLGLLAPEPPPAPKPVPMEVVVIPNPDGSVPVLKEPSK